MDWHTLRDTEVYSISEALQNAGRPNLPRRLCWHMSGLPVQIQYYILRGVANGNVRHILGRIRRRLGHITHRPDGGVLYAEVESENEVSSDHSSDFDDMATAVEDATVAMWHSSSDDADSDVHESSGSEDGGQANLVRMHE